MQIIGEQDGMVGVVISVEELALIAALVGATNKIERDQKLSNVLGHESIFCTWWDLTEAQVRAAVTDTGSVWNTLHEYLTKRKKGCS